MTKPDAIYEILHTYTLEIRGPAEDAPAIRDGSVYLNPDFLRETEENLTDLLPDGYSVKIKEWDDER